MTFIKEFETELGRKLLNELNGDAIVRWASGKVLESYHNGIKAGESGEHLKKVGKKRAPFRQPATLPGQSAAH
jgi:hypothetical protein